MLSPARTPRHSFVMRNSHSPMVFANTPRLAGTVAVAPGLLDWRGGAADGVGGSVRLIKQLLNFNP